MKILSFFKKKKIETKSIENINENVDKLEDLDKLQDIVYYLLKNCKNYIYIDNGLSESDLNRLLYLIDWRSCIVQEKPITIMRFNKRIVDPTTILMIILLKYEKLFMVELRDIDKYIHIRNKHKPKLSNETKEIVDFIIKTYNKCQGLEFIQTIYSTYPMLGWNNDDYKIMDLVALAKEYKKSKKTNS